MFRAVDTRGVVVDFALLFAWAHPAFTDF